MLLRQVFDDHLAQYAYLIGCQQTREALVIDPERDVDRYLDLAAAEDLTITAVAETHIHADFVSGARELAARHDVMVYVSDEGGPDWKYTWVGEPGIRHRLLKDGDTFAIGNIELTAKHTPGHTPEHLSYAILDRGGSADEPMGLATGDFVFVGDVGRPDLLETAAGIAGAMRPAAQRLLGSVRAFLDLPDYLQIWPGHGAGSACGKALGAIPTSTVGYERRFNDALRLAGGQDEAFLQAILHGQPEPPLYFARMKRVNKEGPPVLGALPSPPTLDAEGAREVVRRQGVLIDARGDRDAFMRAHPAGALFAPLDRTFPTVVGSYVEPGQPIHLILDPECADLAVRDLVRIGLDDIAGIVPPQVADEIAADPTFSRTIETTDFAGLARLRDRPGTAVLDVRRRTEFDEGHVPDALNISHTRLLSRLGDVPHGGPVIVHCRSGARAATAVALLARHGFQAVLIDDEFSNWPSPAAVQVP